MKTLQTEQVKGPILVVLPKFIGDAINAIPAMKLLHTLYPNNKLVLLASAAVCELLTRAEFTNLDFVCVDSFGKSRVSIKLINELRKRKLSLAFLFRGSLGDALLCKLAGIRTLIGYAQNGRSPLLSYALRLNPNHHYINRYCRLINEPHNNPFAYFTHPTLRTDSYTRPDNSQNRKVICVYMGSANKGTRYYPSQSAHTALSQIARQTECEFLLIGAEHEKADNAQLCHALKSSNIEVTDLSGKTNMTELVDTIAQSNLMISIDSGPMHIACAVNVNCIALVGIGTSPWSSVEPLTKRCIPLFANPLMLDDSKKLASISPDKLAKLAINLLKTQIDKDTEREYSQ
ncbi:lipopolysaccharide heptosyltransferase II [Pseudoalteromonas sp. A25]|uniref:glycosyltransferase family 9 protein n=1 Tax=Pseudoalteromonas sp. A25 TaxID=116092 RepID=UPI0012610091|nr:glycosyltransferase family 9 protein [Pseudoalteromonas sp. A25]BBN82897.1 lipopolysaccharide heptosyltransferase II [Pseudoalteromonas sp. A25]